MGGKVKVYFNGISNSLEIKVMCEQQDGDLHTNTHIRIIQSLGQVSIKFFITLFTEIPSCVVLTVFTYTMF